MLSYKSGISLIKSELVTVPNSPGIYRMLGADKQVIYIGKAKNLRKRLINYASPSLKGRTIRMLSLTYHLEYEVTNSEAEAFLLESLLIKQFKPKFNILLRRNKYYPYIKIYSDHDYPKLIKCRGKNLQSEELFGPYASAKQIDAVLEELQKIFKLRSCTNSYFSTRERPCLQHQIGRCYAPCVGKITKEFYAELVTQVKAFLSGKITYLKTALTDKMEELSAKLLYEEAIEVRERIKAINNIASKSYISDSVIDADVIAIAQQNNRYCLQIFIYRSGIRHYNRCYFPIHTEEQNKSEVLASFIGQFYQGRPAPREVILSHSVANRRLIEKAITKLHERKVIIATPNNDNKQELVDFAYQSACFSLEHKLKHQN